MQFKFSSMVRANIQTKSSRGWGETVFSVSLPGVFLVTTLPPSSRSFHVLNTNTTNQGMGRGTPALVWAELFNKEH